MRRLRPDNARLGHCLFRVRYIHGSAGSAYVRSHDRKATRLLVGSASPGSPFNFVNVWLRIDSLRCFGFRTTGDVRVTATCLGYDMTEPS